MRIFAASEIPMYREHQVMVGSGRNASLKTPGVLGMSDRKAQGPHSLEFLMHMDTRQSIALSHYFSVYSDLTSTTAFN